MKRKLPKNCDIFLDAAIKAKLSFPLGRALYACNRIQNGGFRFSVLTYTGRGMDNKTGETFELPEELGKIRESTAKRWIKHWKAGGSVKSLSHGSKGR